ncbi:MAG: hypothetical protein ACHQCE_01395 [Streptosporangiales bacterium]
MVARRECPAHPTGQQAGPAWPSQLAHQPDRRGDQGRNALAGQLAFLPGRIGYGGGLRPRPAPDIPHHLVPG